jgi:hypothetical protein
MWKYNKYFASEITLHVAKIVNTVQLQRYMPYKHGCFRYIIVNTLHKSDNKDNDNNNNTGEKYYSRMKGN